MSGCYIRPGFVQPKDYWCADIDKHEGLRTPLAEMKQHMVDVHGFVYDEARIKRKAEVRRTCPTCRGAGWIGGQATPAVEGAPR